MTKFQSVSKRFLKGVISGAVTAMGMVTLAQPTTWTDIRSILGMLGLAAAFGAINGLLLALQKWASWQE